MPAGKLYQFGNFFTDSECSDGIANSIFKLFRLGIHPYFTPRHEPCLIIELHYLMSCVPQSMQNRLPSCRSLACLSSQRFTVICSLTTSPQLGQFRTGTLDRLWLRLGHRFGCILLCIPYAHSSRARISQPSAYSRSFPNPSWMILSTSEIRISKL